MPFKRQNIKNGLLYAFMSLLVWGGLYVHSAYAATGNGVSTPTTVNGTLYIHKTIFFDGSQYLVFVYNGGAQTCTAIGSCSTAVSTTGYVANGKNTGGHDDQAFLQGVSGSQGLDDALAYICTDLSTDCAYPGGGQSGSTFGDHYGSWFGGSNSLFFSDLPLKDWNNAGAHDAAASDISGNTHFISVAPVNGTTTATTTIIGADIVANINDFQNIGVGYGRLHIHAVQDGAFACINSGALYDILERCNGSNTAQLPFDIDFGTTTLTRVLQGVYHYAQSVTFPGGGRWTLTYQIQQISQPWYFFGTVSNYTTIVSTTTNIIVGQPSPIDIVREAVASSTNAVTQANLTGIGSILSSTTASLAAACNPVSLSSNFNLGDCLVLLIWPGSAAISDNIFIIKNLPPWGYLFRFIDILNATTSTTTLPAIDYSFASTSPMATMGSIHFDPFGSIAESAGLINEMKSDRDDSLTVWQILGPVVRVVIYLALALEILRELSGIDWGGHSKKQRGAS